MWKYYGVVAVNLSKIELSLASLSGEILNQGLDHLWSLKNLLTAYRSKGVKYSVLDKFQPVKLGLA